MLTLSREPQAAFLALSWQPPAGQLLQPVALASPGDHGPEQVSSCCD